MDPSLKREIEFDLRRSEVKEDTTQTPQEVVFVGFVLHSYWLQF